MIQRLKYARLIQVYQVSVCLLRNAGRDSAVSLAGMPLSGVPSAPRSSLALAPGAGILHPHYTCATLITTCCLADILHLAVTMTAPPLRGMAAPLCPGATQHPVNK